MSTQRILVPVDGSILSEQIFPVLKGLFNPADIHLILFQVLPTLAEFVHDYTAAPLPLGPSTYAGRHRLLTPEVDLDDEHYERFAIAEMERTAGGLSKGGYHYDVVIHRGRVVDAILEYAAMNAIDLIAMMTHGRRGMSRLLLGSVAEEILRNATIPVLLYRPVTT